METQLVVLVTAMVVSCAGTDADYRRSCTETDSPRVSLPLDCPVGHMIRVLQWLTAISAKGTVSQCQFHTDCAKSADSDVNEFFPACNGRRTCGEQVNLNGKNYCVNGTKLRYVQLEYDCIPETSVLNICDHTSASASSLNSSSLYIKSPAIPGPHILVFNQSCTCVVRGENLTVKMLSLKTSDRGGAIAIADDSAVVWRLATTGQLWNRNISGLQGPGTRYVNITFNDNGSSGEEAWLQISGSERNISILCGRGDNLVETTVALSTAVEPTTSPPSSPMPTSSDAVNTSAPTTASTTGRTSEVSSITSSAVNPPSTTAHSTHSTHVTSAPADPSSSSRLPAVATPDGSSQATPSSSRPSNPSCVDVSCTAGPGTTSSSADGVPRDERNILIIAISATAGGLLLLVIIIVVVVLCRRKRRLKENKDDLDRVPAPNGDLYTVCSKASRKDSSSSSAGQKGGRHNNTVAPYAWLDLHLPRDPQDREGGGQAGDRNSHLYWTLEANPQAHPGKGGNSKGDNQPLYWVVEPEGENARRFLGEQRVWPTESPREYRDVHPYAVADIYTQHPQRPGVGVPVKHYQSADTDLQIKAKDAFMVQTRLRNAHSYETPTSKRNSLLSSLLFFTNSSKQDPKKAPDDENDSAIGYSASDEAASENISSILRVREDYDPFGANYSGDSGDSDGEVKIRPSRVRQVEGRRGKHAVGLVVTSRPRPKFATVEVHSPQVEKPSERPPTPPPPRGSAVRRGHRRSNANSYEDPVMTTPVEAEDDQPWKRGDGQPWNSGNGQVVEGAIGQVWDDSNGQPRGGGDGQPWGGGNDQFLDYANDQLWDGGDVPRSDDGDGQPWDGGNDQPWNGGNDQFVDCANGQLWDDGDSQPRSGGEGQTWSGGDGQPWDGGPGCLGEGSCWDGNTTPPETADEDQWLGPYRGGRTSSTYADTESNLDDDSFLYDDVLNEDAQTPRWNDSGMADAGGKTSITVPLPQGSSERELGHGRTDQSKSGFPERACGDLAHASEMVLPKGEILKPGDGEGEGVTLQAILHSQETWC